MGGKQRVFEDAYSCMLTITEHSQHGLPWDVPYELPNTGGVIVTVLHANHCEAFRRG